MTIKIWITFPKVNVYKYFSITNVLWSSNPVAHIIMFFDENRALFFTIAVMNYYPER